MRECESGQGELSPLRFFQRNAHVFDEKIKNFEMGVSNAIKNTILEIQKVS